MFAVGLDLGQMSDYSALVVLQKVEEEYHARHMQRWPLGTAYPDLVRDVHRLMHTPPLAGAGTLVIDATGVGVAVVDMFKGAPFRCVPVTITGGQHTHREGGRYHVPKKDLIAAVQVWLQAGTLKIAASLPEAGTLTTELQNYRVHITQAAHETFNAREGQHDDLVLALALACWYWRQHAGSTRRHTSHSYLSM